MCGLYIYVDYILPRMLHLYVYVNVKVYVYVLVHILSLSDPVPVARSFSRARSGDMLLKEIRYVFIEKKLVIYFREPVDLS